LIICSNHSNQFVDGTVIVANNKREIHFIGAAKSVKKPIIGHLLRAIKTIPVERA
jgi:1-acyl-sn-glycerol-3-phosphate acyltransferase